MRETSPSPTAPKIADLSLYLPDALPITGTGNTFTIATLPQSREMIDLARQRLRQVP